MALSSSIAADSGAMRFMPDFALCLSVFSLFYSLTLFDAPHKLFRDSDTGWHIRTGEAVLANRAIPRTDPYSFSRAGQPWFAWEWLSDVAMGAVHRAAGLPGIAVLFSFLIAAATYLWVKLTWAVGGSFLFTAVLAAPMLSTVNLHWLARPHIIGWVFTLLAVLYAEHAPRKFRVIDAAACFSGSALWANMHGSFFLATCIALIYFIGEWVRSFIWAVQPRRARWFGWAVLFSSAGTFLNVYGTGLHTHLFNYLTDRELLDRVGEFQSFNFHSEGAAQIVITLLLATIGGVLALTQKNVAQFLLIGLLVAGALRSARGLPLVALLGLPVANGAISRALLRASGLRFQIARARDRFFTYSANLRNLDRHCSGTALALVVAAGALLWLRVPAGFPAAEFPTVAAAHLPREARTLAPDKFGGYLIYRAPGNPKVFFDGRSDFYGSRFMKDYIRLVQVRPGWKDVFDRYRFTHALLPRDAALIPALETLGWRQTFQDAASVLMEPHGS